MEAVLHTSITKKNVNIKSKAKSDFWEMAEFNRFGVIAFVLAIVACFSAVVAGFFVDGSSQLELTLAIIPTMATLCSILVVAPVRIITIVGALSIVADVLLMIF